MRQNNTLTYGKIQRCQTQRNDMHITAEIMQGRVVRKPVNVNPGLNVNWSITFSY